MRKIKTLAVAAIATAMTMAMGVSAFAMEAKDVTFHFKNVKGWDTVGAWVWEGKAFSENVSPADKCAVVNGEKQLWPGAKCEDEGNGWVKVTASFKGTYEDAVLIFNNWVADNKTNDTTTQEDLDMLAASGVLCDSTAKEQSPNIMIGVPRDGFVAFDANEYWIEWDGASTGLIGADGSGLTKEAPASYTAPSTDTPADEPSEDPTDAPADEPSEEDPTDAPADKPTEEPADKPAEDPTDAPAENATKAPATDNDGKGSGEGAPQTGDAASMAVVLLGLAAAGYAVSKKVHA